jgi:hypothetical protein
MSSQVPDPEVGVAMKDLEPLSIPIPKIQGLQVIKGGQIDFDKLPQQKIVLVIFLLNTYDVCIDDIPMTSLAANTTNASTAWST